MKITAPPDPDPSANDEENLPSSKSVESRYDFDNEKTKSPFDYLDEVLEGEPDLNHSREALDSSETESLINEYGKFDSFLLTLLIEFCLFWFYFQEII